MDIPITQKRVYVNCPKCAFVVTLPVSYSLESSSDELEGRAIAKAKAVLGKRGIELCSAPPRKLLQVECQGTDCGATFMAEVEAHMEVSTRVFSLEEKVRAPGEGLAQSPRPLLGGPGFLPE